MPSQPTLRRSQRIAQKPQVTRLPTPAFSTSSEEESPKRATNRAGRASKAKFVTKTPKEGRAAPLPTPPSSNPSKEDLFEPTPAISSARKNRKYVASWLDKHLPAFDLAAVESGSDTDEDDDEEEEDDSEWDDFDDLTAEDIDIVTGDRRKCSVDSRFEPGNEDYECDDFVVDDDDVEESCPESDGDSEITVVKKRTLIKRQLKRILSFAQSPSTVQGQRSPIHFSAPPPKRARTSIPSPLELISPKNKKQARRGPFLEDSSSDDANDNGPTPTKFDLVLRGPALPPIGRGRSTSKSIQSNSVSSRLFCSDSSSSQRSSVVVAPSQQYPAAKEVLVSEDPDEIVECINDGIALFSRRCNANKSPMVLVLAPEVSRDYDVKEALRNAIRLRLAEMVGEDEEGIETWVIRPATGSLSTYIE